jgi:hypothetical protein
VRGHAVKYFLHVLPKAFSLFRAHIENPFSM